MWGVVFTACVIFYFSFFYLPNTEGGVERRMKLKGTTKDTTRVSSRLRMVTVVDSSRSSIIEYFLQLPQPAGGLAPQHLSRPEPA
jgi:hypothetical protein